MSTTAQEAKEKRLKKKSKYSSRVFNRCQMCGRARGYHRMFKLCRICLRDKALAGDIPGLRKSSW
ncbi:MAG: type Z 30S ribosomal protein S14 [Candidatus Dojkabacteria bacterium]|uniref:Small ribosomal subunit protein uS14 n=2 Tax=Candidatus Dojkabacteria TaxID=74243 RepID=A0A136KKU8_9BACT|nr:MAG: 30S ribosomal protein S14 type Z [candidate division WS6 bacterium OLB21]MBW7953596.1 type Z 30S ribosomal protein S14 [Candidatus Dojkabacteria bacterium]WKZ27871.1 MAG: type Z 30S ribosomal protein S14 [Candidatus Dojkabacteria bacterium]